ncbi:hypothetical protein BST14_24960 [Mycobacterium arosiense ATCC BAA-1401 = DSM 45069]|uniref:Uncharacterized protein n=1 Tax=Mycobacterium arosiense ATCC BAA-1401 = DSM 45069 TaxID=1265311 RepID=A0A1W9Z6T4_MYCAI|nr:hypothetical protein BST14_24960 [Mycobacterium arosiense ATCC BAA-1401 = DSM 45069]
MIHLAHPVKTTTKHKTPIVAHRSTGDELVGRGPSCVRWLVGLVTAVIASLSLLASRAMSDTSAAGETI